MAATQFQSRISPRELNRRLNAGLPTEVLDVRSPAEFETVHVAGTRLLPLDELDCATFLAERANLENPIYVLCQSGSRAARAADQFRRDGFEACVLVEGGMDAWVEAGLPVERSNGRVLPLMRQVQIIVGLATVLGSTMALLLDPRFALVPLAMGGGLLFAGLTGICGLALFLARMPWNKARNRVPACCPSDKYSKHESTS